jgi:hypothetical protein
LLRTARDTDPDCRADIAARARLRQVGRRVHRGLEAPAEARTVVLFHTWITLQNRILNRGVPFSRSGHGLRSSVGPCRDGGCRHAVCGVGGGGSGADVRGQLRQPVVPRVQARSVEFELRGRGSEPAHGAVALLRPAVSACHGTDGTAPVRTRLAA